MAAFYLDHNVARELADHLRGFGHVAHTAHELGMDRAGDEVHLGLAARSDWTLITHNAGDFRLLDAAWRQRTREWGVGIVEIVWSGVAVHRWLNRRRGAVNE